MSETTPNEPAAPLSATPLSAEAQATIERFRRYHLDNFRAHVERGTTENIVFPRSYARSVLELIDAARQQASEAVRERDAARERHDVLLRALNHLTEPRAVSYDPIRCGVCADIEDVLKVAQLAAPPRRTAGRRRGSEVTGSPGRSKVCAYCGEFLLPGDPRGGAVLVSRDGQMWSGEYAHRKCRPSAQEETANAS